MLILRRLRHLQRTLWRAIWVIILEQGEIVPFVSLTFEWGAVIATFVSWEGCQRAKTSPCEQRDTRATLTD